MPVNMSKGAINSERDVEFLFSALSNSEKIISAYQSKITERSFQYIQNEIKAYFCGGILRQAWLRSWNDIARKKQFPGEDNMPLTEKIDQIQIHEFYNDFGLFSRQSIEDDLRYQYFRLNNSVQYRIYAGNLIRTTPEPELELQFSRMVLTGSPLYREIAKTLIQILEQRSLLNSIQIRTDYLNDFVFRNFDLMNRRCNDLELLKKVDQIVEQHKKLDPGNFVPEIELVDIHNKKVSIKDFLGGKPTVFHFSSDWIGNRYGYDDAGKLMPEINFVMVVEGSNFKQWEEYTNLAQPIITHLFYFNDKKSFRDIFQSPKVHMVFNKEGEYIGNAGNPKNAARLAKDSLEPQKKELNKSQLKIIILALGILILIALVVFAIWKWRVRQRFRREQQQRRLRELELTAIRSQMNPHFLFNCLNSVQNLVQQNKGREAHLYLSDFAGLIRKVLQNSEKEEVSLAEELEMTEQYLNLEKLRFEFDFQIQVERGIDINNTMVPSMLLQPFAENAVIHGLQSKPENRKLRIEVVREGGGEGKGEDKSKDKGRGEDEEKGMDNLESTRLAASSRLAHQSSKGNAGIIITIEDNGIGREAAAAISKAKNGKGSKLIQERLEILKEKQGEKYRLNTIDLKEGTRVEIYIPEEK